MKEIDTSKKSLRSFGLIFGVILIFIFSLFLPWLFSYNSPNWPYIIGTIFFLLALVYPLVLKRFYLIWLKFGEFVSYFSNRIILSFIFYSLFLPVSIVLKLVKYDAMRKKYDPKCSSYRIKSENSRNDLTKPF